MDVRLGQKVSPELLGDQAADYPSLHRGSEVMGEISGVGRPAQLGKRMWSSGSMRAQIETLILATSGVQLANGFFNTLISLRVVIEDFEATMAGLVPSSYFAGFTLAAVRCERIIERVGHIRAYAAFAGLVVTATAAMPLLIGPLAWLVLRAVIGFGCAGLFITTESWLNAKAEPEERGRTFSLYMVGRPECLNLNRIGCIML